MKKPCQTVIEYLNEFHTNILTSKWINSTFDFYIQKADVNGDGVLSVDEYYRILKDHGVTCSRDEILQIIQIADKDHDG